MRWAVLGTALMIAATASGCRTNQFTRVCEACIEKEGATFCGKSATNLKKHPDVTVEDGKLAAGRAACIEYGARKGGGYQGPPFLQARDACADAVRAKDLRRARCDEVVLKKPWNPRDGVDAL